MQNLEKRALQNRRQLQYLFVSLRLVLSFPLNTCSEEIYDVGSLVISKNSLKGKAEFILYVQGVRPLELNSYGQMA